MCDENELRRGPGVSGFREQLYPDWKAYEQNGAATQSSVRQLQPALWQSEVAQASIPVNEPLLDIALGYMRGEDDRFWLGLNESVRHHNRTHAVRLLVWVNEALRIPGYFEQKLALKDIPVAANACSVERAQYAAAARLASHDSELDEGGELSEQKEKALRERVSRLARTTAGIAAACRRAGTETSFATTSNIMALVANLTDKQLWDAAAQAESSPPIERDHDPVGQGQLSDDGSERSNGLVVALVPIQPAAQLQSADQFSLDVSADRSSSGQFAPLLHPALRKMLPLVGKLDSPFPDPATDLPDQMLIVGIRIEGSRNYEYFGPIVLNYDGLELLHTALRQADVRKS